MAEDAPDDDLPHDEYEITFDIADTCMVWDSRTYRLDVLARLLEVMLPPLGTGRATEFGKPIGVPRSIREAREKAILAVLNDIPRLISAADAIDPTESV